MQAKPAVWKHFGRSLADTGAKSASGVHVVITHVEAASRIADRDQTTELDMASLVRCPDASAVLAVMETSLDITGAIGSVGGTDEQAVVEAERRRNRIAERFFRRGIGIGEGEGDGGVTLGPPILEPLFRLFHRGDVAGGN